MLLFYSNRVYTLSNFFFKKNFYICILIEHWHRIRHSLDRDTKWFFSKMLICEYSYNQFIYHRSTYIFSRHLKLEHHRKVNAFLYKVQRVSWIVNLSDGFLFRQTWVNGFPTDLFTDDENRLLFIKKLIQSRLSFIGWTKVRTKYMYLTYEHLCVRNNILS